MIRSPGPIAHGRGFSQDQSSKQEERTPSRSDSVMDLTCISVVVLISAKYMYKNVLQNRQLEPVKTTPHANHDRKST